MMTNRKTNQPNIRSLAFSLPPILVHHFSLSLLVGFMRVSLLVSLLVLQLLLNCHTSVSYFSTWRTLRLVLFLSNENKLAFDCTLSGISNNGEVQFQISELSQNDSCIPCDIWVELSTSVATTLVSIVANKSPLVMGKGLQKCSFLSLK